MPRMNKIHRRFTQGYHPQTTDERRQYRAWLRAQTPSKHKSPKKRVNHFDSLLLVDCWDEQWINTLPIGAHMHKHLEFYGRILDFTRRFHFDNVYANSDRSTDSLHSWFTDRWSVTTISPQDLDIIRDQRILVAGQAWNLCLHEENQISFVSAHKHNTVYSSPLVVTDHYNKKYNQQTASVNDIQHIAQGKQISGLVNNESFVSDKRCKWIQIKDKELEPYNIWQLEAVIDPAANKP